MNLKEEVRIARALGTLRKPRRMPKQVYPRAIEREYTRILVSIARRNAKALSDIIPLLKGLVQSRKRSDSAHLDVGESERVSRIINAIRRRVTISTEDAENLARLIGRRTQIYSTEQLRKQIYAALGIDISQVAGLVGSLQGFVAENAALITSITQQTLERTEAAIIRGLNAGHLHGDIAKEVRKAGNFGIKRAKLIARDQVGKHYQQVQKARQTQVGIEHFMWTTSRDRRVRPAHVSADGNRYSWAKGHPTEGLPGEPVLCRCTGDPDLSGILD